MILHFVIDGKLTDQLIENFFKVSNNNHFLVFGKNHKQEAYDRITKTGDYLTIYDEKIDEINKIITDLKVKTIITHALTDSFAKVINQINNDRIKICWIAWGYDVYNLPKIKFLNYGKKTYRFLLKNAPISILDNKIKKNDFLRNLVYGIINSKDPIIEVYRCHKRIDYFATYTKQDYEIFSKFYPNEIQFVHTTFSTIEQYLAGNKDLKLNHEANSILLGNSYSPTSNYLEAMDFLKSETSKFDFLYTVLSYGSNEKYKNKILEKGKDVFGKSFYPLISFISRDKYVKILQNCSVGFFNHYRQQAMGNIIAMLYMGSRIYLSKKNPAYHYLIENKIVVNNIESEFNKFGISRLSAESVENNRKRLYDLFNTETVISDLNKLTNLITISK